MQCGNCGREIPLSSGKCPHCGASAAQQEYFHAPVKQNTPEKPQAPRRPPQKRHPVKDSTPPRKKPASKKPAAKAKPPVERKKRTPRSKILFIVLLFWAVLAISVYSSSFSFFSNDDRYLQTGEDFVRALILQDEASLSSYIHSSMRGNLYPLGHQGADSCEVHGSVADEADAESLGRELSEQYGLQETVAAARWILVEYTMEENGQTTTCSIEVLLANIGGDIYAVKTRNMIDDAAISSTT